MGAPRTQLESDSPPALRQATPDVDLAEAQMALGRPELVGDEGEPEPVEDELEGDADTELPSEPRAAGDGGSGGSGRGGSVAVAGVPGGPAAPAPRVWAGARLLNFLQGSWRELQRVQWPDRRQVMQATGVVIGFVIVAGVFLGVADWAATKIVNFVLTGHW